VCLRQGDSDPHHSVLSDARDAGWEAEVAKF
jgi:hypothetical protein